MLRTNLSTRPFYNTRAARTALGVLALGVAIMTLVNAAQLLRLTGSERSLGARAAEAEAEAGRLLDQARQARAQIDPRDLQEVSSAAAEANGLIELRAFSWSGLFAHVEGALPERVRLTRFEPYVDRDGRFMVGARVEARDVRDLEAFLEALERTGVFREVLAAEEQLGANGFLNATIEGVYSPEAAGE